MSGSGATQHYERRDDGFYLVWGADFSGDEPGELKLPGNRGMEEWDPRARLYMDLRTRPSGAEVNEMGRCRRCDEYVPIMMEAIKTGDCAGHLQDGESKKV
jgi:hypothetical protein